MRERKKQRERERSVGDVRPPSDQVFLRPRSVEAGVMAGVEWDRTADTAG